MKKVFIVQFLNSTFESTDIDGDQKARGSG